MRKNLNKFSSRVFNRERQMAEKIIMEEAGVKLVKTDKGYSYYIEEMCIFEDLPEFMKPMLIKSFNNLVEIRKKEQ